MPVIEAVEGAEEINGCGREVHDEVVDGLRDGDDGWGLDGGGGRDFA